MAANVPQVKASQMATIAPSLLKMDNGAVVRNLMGSTTNDTHVLRLWGTRGSADAGTGKDSQVQLELRLGGKGGSPKMVVEPEWPELGELAESMGHGGGDFWVSYYFAREILTGEPAFWSVHRAADVTLPGIMSYRSALAGGQPMDIPDFRKKSDRDAYRKDNKCQKEYDWKKGPFPKNGDKKLLSGFTKVMSDMIDKYATGARAVIDFLTVADQVKEVEKVIELTDTFIEQYPEMKKTFARARKIMNAYPRSDGAQIIREMLDVAEADRVSKKSFLDYVKAQRRRLKRKLKK